MVRNQFRWVTLVGVLLVAAGTSGQAREHKGVNFSGQIDDVTIVTAGSWAMHGTWSLNVDGDWDNADFTAAIDMERSDYFYVATPTADPNSPTTRNAHTHNIAIVKGTVTSIPNGFRVSGPAMLTGNGATPPFGTDSTLQVDVTGGNLVTFSNVKLTFGGNAALHFGTLPVSGVVRRWK